ncbi:3-deoxy-D-manno-octulosonic acid transferase [Flavobacterium sp. HSC-61S13]|uniref:3-deoxy-D-manno-octulosonic acid transferase n=1 Tax=Flavobacterium sp. HSC-61S13 TaxID=2910963 RepID=UPI0020A17288|nr:glycosyltransferase N-terminal domain-containing protein [Flavobacterium sp. HSC-61S13]MCP1996882.1 3-deoxy-D-manno-octulosonic-acid transferase [Flavobacterium sp. HSC-61S13]
MFFIYNLFTQLVNLSLKFVALFNKKIHFFVEGRKNSFTLLSREIKPTDRTFWIHAASLGEYEQGLPLIERLKQLFPQHKIILTFFSPSGYEVKKNNTPADVTLYLPMDTISNAKRFLTLAHPDKVFFIKYEYWPNYLNELKKQNIETYLVSGILRPDQVFFKWYGSFYRKALTAFTYFFVQNEGSKELLTQLGHDAIVTGDTRFDRVAQILEQDNTLDFVAAFKANKTLLVAGSSWPKDEELLVDFINHKASKDMKFIFAPHNIKPDLTAKLQQQLQKSVILYSQITNQNLAEYDVLIIDAYSLLTKTYSYADIAYIGGGFGAGIHNILEAATFGIPVVIGPNYKKFQEAKDLIERKGCLVVHNATELHETLNQLFSQPQYRKQLGSINSAFILSNKNATEKIIQAVFSVELSAK